MLDIHLIRDNFDFVKKNLERRQQPDIITKLVQVQKLDEEWRQLKKEVEELKHKRNMLSEQINELKKQNKDIKKVLEEVKDIPKQIKEREEKQNALEKSIRNLLLRIPNIMHDSVPYGLDSNDNVPIRTWGTPRKFDFELKPHGELMEEQGFGDFDRSAKLSGAGFYFLKGDLALLNLSLIRFAIDHLNKKGFIYVEPPLMISRKAYEGVTDLEDFEKVMYKAENEDLYFIATSEHPLVSQHMDELIPEETLPFKYAGYSMCFRKEIGSHGVDTKGLFRTHQFNKVEQVVFCRPEDSEKIHEEITKNSEEMLQLLEIPYQVVNICTGDLGIVATKKYDIEAWFPRQKSYAEVCSSSNCTDYQARRLNIKCIDKQGNKRILHTLNNTGIATSRILVAILENYQNEDGSVSVPKILIPYMNGIKKLKPNKI